MRVLRSFLFLSLVLMLHTGFASLLRPSNTSHVTGPAQWDLFAHSRQNEMIVDANNNLYVEIRKFSLRQEDIRACWNFGTLLSGLPYTISWSGKVEGMPEWALSHTIQEQVFPYHRYTDFKDEYLSTGMQNMQVSFIPD